MANSIKNIITRQYGNFLGVDFRGGEVPTYHSPDALNMWRDYTDSDCIQTRPSMQLINSFDNSIFGLFFYKVNNTIQVLVHSGTKLLKWNNYPTTPANTTELFTGLKAKEGTKIIYNGIFYYLDGLKFIKYDGTTATEVAGTIPDTSYYMNPDGSTDMDSQLDSDTINQGVNCLQAKRRNKYISDGESTVYHLDTQVIDQTAVEVEVYDRETGDTTKLYETLDFTVDRTKGYITFKEVITSDKLVYVLFAKTVSGLRDRILNCTIFTEFDNRFFASGNPDYPQAIFWCEEEDIEYFAEDNKLEVGMDLSNVKTLIPGNNVLWAIKETGQNNAGAYYLTPTINSTYGKYYVPVSGNISTGCVSTGINFNDDIVFFSKNGLEGINSSSLYSEQVLGHRSTYIDARLLGEENYEKIKLCEYQGYLLALINSNVYLADKRKRISTGSGSTEYEWFYWELPNDITYMTEYQGQLFLGNEDGDIYSFSYDGNEVVSSYWTTCEDTFGYPSYTKTTGKKGAEMILKELGNTNIKIESIADKVVKKEQILSDTKGYAVFKMKNKKFFKLQYKISSNSRFGIYSAVVQGFVAGYLKR